MQWNLVRGAPARRRRPRPRPGCPPRVPRASTWPTTLPANDVASKRPSPVSDERRDRDSAARRPTSVRDERRTGHERRAVGGEPAREAAGRPDAGQPRDVDAARRRGSGSASRVEPPLRAPRPPRRRRPSAGRRRAPRRRTVVETSQATTTSAPRRSKSSASSAPRPPSTVADPPTATIARRDAGVERRPEQLAGAERRRAKRVVPPLTSARPLARAISITAVSPRRPHSASTGRAERPGHLRSAAVVADGAEDVERSLAAVREGKPHRRAPGALDARGERVCGLARRQASAELVGTAEDGRRRSVTQRASARRHARRPSPSASSCGRAGARGSRRRRRHGALRLPRRRRSGVTTAASSSAHAARPDRVVQRLRACAQVRRRSASSSIASAPGSSSSGHVRVRAGAVARTRRARRTPSRSVRRRARPGR